MPLFVDAIAAFRNKGSAKRRESSDWFYPPMTSQGAINLADGLTASYSAIYRGQPWVYAAMNKIARSVARTPLKVYEGPSSNRKYVTDGTLYELLAHPMKPYGTPFRYKERTVKSIGIYGPSFTIKLGMKDESDTPTELLPAPSIGWSISGGDYIWTSRAGVEHSFKAWQVIRTDFWDCDDDGFGMSMLEPLRMTLAVEDAAQRYAVSAFKNGARPSSILKTDKDLKPVQVEALAAHINAIHGGPDKALKVAFLTNGLDWAPWPKHNLEEAALINHRELTREEVAAVIDVPQPTIGILDEANFASVDILHTMLYQDSCGPWFALIEQSLQAQLVDATPEFEGLKIEFDMHGLMRGSDATQYRNFATAISAPLMTPNEARARENLPRSEQPEADMLQFQLNTSTGAVGAQLAEDTGAPDNAKAISQNGAVHA